MTRGPPSNSQTIETKKPAPDLSARVERTHLDDATMPVFCPTCQSLSKMRQTDSAKWTALWGRIIKKARGQTRRGLH